MLHLALVACVSADALPDPSGSTPSRPATAYIQVEALSAGRGVPVNARETFHSIREQAEGLVASGGTLRIDEQVIGLEGERRLCIAFDQTPEADAFFEQVVPLVEGIDLLRLSRTPCTGMGDDH